LLRSLTRDAINSGLDVQQTNLVINYDVPRSAAAHVRRVGRAGRFSRKGAAVTLLAAGGNDEALLEQLRADIPFSTSPLRSLELR
jgi:superfamily II DNA/RNA helicase